MALAASENDPSNTAAPGSDSEYGHDEAEDTLLADVLNDIEVHSCLTSFAPTVVESIEEHATRSPARISQDSNFLVSLDHEENDTSFPPNPRFIRADRGRLQVELDLFKEASFPVSTPPPNDTTAPQVESEKPPVRQGRQNVPDTRNPLERFRTPPKKPLSVTDLVSPAWCELQYWYNLTKFGRVPTTAAMKRGSSVHKALEEQVQVSVPVDTKTMEDTWGLRIWNVIQGLRALRVTGMTREIELWGMIDGEVVRGVIDELTKACPDRDLEAMLDGSGKSGKKQAEVAQGQKTLSEVFKYQDDEDKKSSRSHPKVYIMDVKTRGSASMPRGASLRPTHMQLMLYRKLLAGLGSNEVDAEVIFRRFGLNSSLEFSDTLIDQLGDLDMNFHEDATEDSYAPMESGIHAIAELLQHNTLSRLWQLMIQEFQKALPDGPDSVGKVLKAEFRSSGEGKLIGARTFRYDEDEINAYVADEMSWWRGKREAKGVDIEEAFKCRICEFADGCTWRANKIDEAIQKHRLRSNSRRESQV